MDEPEDEEPAPTRRKQSKAAQKAKEKGKAKEKEKAKAKAKKGKKGDDDNYEDEGEDPYSALSKMWKGDLPKPPVGNFENCAKCEKQFTVVRTRPYYQPSSHSRLAVVDEVYHGREPSSRVALPHLREICWCRPLQEGPGSS